MGNEAQSVQSWVCAVGMPLRSSRAPGLSQRLCRSGAPREIQAGAVSRNMEAVVFNELPQGGDVEEKAGKEAWASTSA